MDDRSSSSPQCEPHQVSAEKSSSSNEEDLFFLWNKPPTSDSRLFTFYDTVQVRTAIHSSRKQSATALSPLLRPPFLVNDHFTPNGSDNGGGFSAIPSNTPHSLTNTASTLLCSGVVYELMIGSKVLIASGDSLPFVGEIISLFQNKKSGKMQFKVRWFWYKSDIDGENPKILRRFEKYPVQNIDLSQYLDSESLPHVEKIFSSGSPVEVFYSTATDVNDLETILRPCYVLFIDEQNSQNIASGGKGASNDSDRDQLPNRDAFLCRYEYIVKEEKLVPISRVKSLDEAQRLAHTVATMLRVISYYDLTDREAHARFNDNPKAWVDLQRSIEFANAEKSKEEEKLLRKARFALVKSWLGMSYDELRTYLVSVRSTAQQQQLLLSSTSPSTELPSDPLLEQQQLEVSADGLKIETALEKLDDDQNSIDWIKPSQTDDFGHALMYDVAGVVAIPQEPQFSHVEDNSINFNSSSYNGASSSGRDAATDKETLSLGMELWPLSPKNGESSLSQVNSPYLKDKKEEKENQIREGAAYQARVPSLASTAFYLMLQLSSATEEEVLYWEDDQPKTSFEDGRVWSPVRNEAAVERFLSKATIIVEQLKADCWALFRQKASHGQSSESAGFGPLEATMRSEALLSDPIRIDGSFVLIDGELEEILLTILFECGYHEARALAVVTERIPQYFVPWSYAEHLKLVKGSERTKGRTILNSYGKLKSTKSRRQILDYYFRYLRSAVKLPVETSTRLLSDSAVVTSRVIPACFADNHIIDFEIDLLKYNMLTDFLVRLRKTVDEVSYMEIVNSIVEFLQGLETASAMIIRMKLVLLRSCLRAPVDVNGEDRQQVAETPPYDSVQQIFSDFSLFVPVFVSHDELQMYFFKRSSIHNFI